MGGEREKNGRTSVESDGRSSAPTRLAELKDAEAGLKIRSRKEKKFEFEGIHDGQCRGAQPFVVPPMKFVIGKYDG